MEAPAAIRMPRRRVLRNETEWAIRESILRANDILGPDGVILKTVIPTLVEGIAGMSHSKVKMRETYTSRDAAQLSPRIWCRSLFRGLWS